MGPPNGQHRACCELRARPLDMTAYGPVCEDMVQSNLWFASSASASASRMGNVDHILTFLSDVSEWPKEGKSASETHPTLRLLNGCHPGEQNT